MILDVISNDPNYKNNMFLQTNGRKTSFKNVTMVTKMLHVYISVTVPDRPIVAIIEWSQMVTFMNIKKKTHFLSKF